jgi:hypothetical protein
MSFRCVEADLKFSASFSTSFFCPIKIHLLIGTAAFLLSYSQASKIRCKNIQVTFYTLLGGTLSSLLVNSRPCIFFSRMTSKSSKKFT